MYGGDMALPALAELDYEKRVVFRDERERLRDSHRSYLQSHPEIKTLLADFIAAATVLLAALLPLGFCSGLGAEAKPNQVTQPSDVVTFARDFFSPFSKTEPLPTPHLMPIVLMGPSGVGKGTLKDRLVKEYPDDFGFSVSHTTRGPRPGEVNGVDYNFISRQEMEEMVKRNEFLEHAKVHTNMYGTSFAAVQKIVDSGKICLLDIDVQGGLQLLSSPIKCVFVFVEPPTIPELERRLRERKTDTEDSIQTRLANAKKELEASYKPGFVTHRIVNDNLETAYNALKGIALRQVEQRRQHIAAVTGVPAAPLVRPPLAGPASSAAEEPPKAPEEAPQAEEPPQAPEEAPQGEEQPLRINESDWFKFLTGGSEQSFNRAAFTMCQDTLPHLPGYMLQLRNTTNGTLWAAGKFSVLSLADLEGIAEKLGGDGPSRGPCEIEFLTGIGWEALDKNLSVAAQQASPANALAVFQAASNFNAVESPDDSLPPDSPEFTENYVWDRTQGPAASVGAGAAAIARVHAAFFDPATPPDEWRQTQDRQVELLGQVKEYFTVNNGYVTMTGAEKPLPTDEAELRELLRKVRIALHSEAQVTFSSENGDTIVVRNGHKIDQVFCAAINIGQGESGEKNAQLPDCAERIRFVLNAAYEGTYLAALANGRKTVYLTLIGGGVFGNPIKDISDAIVSAHLRWSGHPASRLESVKVAMWSRPAPPELVEELKAKGVPVRVTTFEGSERVSALM
eukprot:m51a1_g3107 putative guanylate kinase (737) ;mRNA; f:139385-142032